MDAYFYTPKYRPPSFATLPLGWELVERGTAGNFPGRLDLPVGDTVHGVVRYRRLLSREDVEQFELKEWW